MKNKLFFYTITLILLNSCSTTMKVKPLNKNGYFTIQSDISHENIIDFKKINLEGYNILIIRNLGYDTSSNGYIVAEVATSGVNQKKYENYIINTIKQIGKFDKIYTLSEFENYILQNNLTNDIKNLVEIDELNKLSNKGIKFLILDLDFKYLSGYNYLFKMKINDPISKIKVFDVGKPAFNFGGLDKVLFNPVFNNYIEWLKSNGKN